MRIMAEDQSQTQLASTSEGFPTGGQANVTVTEAQAPVDNATNQTNPAETPETQTPGQSAGDSGTALDVGLPKVTSPQDYLKMVKGLMNGSIPVPEEAPAPTDTEPPEPRPVVLASEVGEMVDPPHVPGKPPAMKVPLPADKEAAALQSETLRILRERNRAGTPITPSAAETLARSVLGLPSAESAAPIAPVEVLPPEDQSPGLPATVEAANKRILELIAEKKQANSNFEFEKAEEMEIELERLRDHKDSLRTQESAAALTTASLEKSWETSRAGLKQQFGDDFTDADSALNIIARSVEADWRANGDARLVDANAPALLYHEAAKKMGRPAAPVTKSPTSKAVSRPPAAAALLASGNAGSAASPPPGPGAATLPQFKNTAEYLAYTANLNEGSAQYHGPRKFA